MRILSNIYQLKNNTEKIVSVEKGKKSYYKGFAKVGDGNTRLKPIAVLESHLDYLRIKIEAISPEKFQLLMSYISPDFVVEMDKAWSPGKDAKYFPNRVLGTRGVKGGFNLNPETQQIDLMVDLPGEYFEDKKAVDQWRLCVGLNSHFEADGTRVDIAIDDPTYSVIPVEQMIQGWRDGYKFGFRKYQHIESGETPEDLKDTDYFGAKGSSKFVRVYEHDEECLRFEAEYKKGRANLIFKEFASLERPEGMPDELWEIELQKYLSSVAVGAIDFRDRGTRKNKTRAGQRDSVRLPFYQEFIDFLGANHYRIKLEKPAKTIVKAVNWVVRQCAPTLTMLKQGLGWENFNPWLKDILIKAEDRLSNQQQLWVKEIQKKPQAYMLN